VTRECGVLLIFDEVISGFRLGYGGAQAHYDVTPDMATYGKIMGGGLPAGAVAGNLDAMQSAIGTGDMIRDKIEGKLLLIGTFSGNPMTSCAGAASYLRGSALGEHMRYHGVYASDLHISFVSAVHTEDDVDRVVRAYKASLRDMRAEGIL
jgi:glutamate-1-semialdehyde 2,1-aminomutase